MKNRLSILAALAACAALSGCAISPAAAPTAAPAQGTAIQGRAMGGQQAVGLATVQLWATGISGYGSASTALLQTPATTAAGTGMFNITGDYTCPMPATTPVYLTITGGNTGGIWNSNLALMAALGPCNGLSSSTFINVNELTTVASVWALAPFMKAIDHVGTSYSNTAGLAMAMALVNEMVNTGTGAVSGPALPAGATLPVDEINGLADILSVCVNSAGGADNDGSNCGTLFHNAKPGATAPTDTVAAALNIAQNPTLNVAALYALIPSAGAVFPTALTQPAAWTIAINYTGGGLSSPQGIANDASGNVWVANAGNNSVTLLSNSGAAQSGATGFTAGPMSSPSSIAIDANGNPWVSNAGNSTLTQLSSTGSTGTDFSGNGLSTPKSISFDSSGNLWVANNGSSSVSVFTGSGGAIGNYSGGGISTPIGIAVNPQ